MILSIFGLVVLCVLVLVIALVVGLLVHLIVKPLHKSGGAAQVLAAGIVAVIVALVIFSAVAQIIVRPVSIVTGTTTDSTQLMSHPRQPHVQIGMESSRIGSLELLPTPAEPSESVASGITVAGTPWSDAVEQFQDFEADVYPSMQAAAEALGRRVGQRLMEAADAGDSDKRSIYVWRDGDLGAISRDVLEAVATGIRQKLDEPAYVSVERPVSNDAVAVGLAVQEIQFDNHNRWGKKAESHSGSIAVRVKTPDGPFAVSTRYIEIPWVADRSAFAASYSNGDWLVGYSDGTHTTHEEAKQDAIWAATDVLLPLAKSRISQLSSSDQHHFAQQMQKDANWLRNRVADELVSRNLLTDRFAQRFDRPYGTVWREAVLVDASPKRVEAIARSLVQGVDAKVTHERNTFISFLALGGLVFGTYLFLNMATKGYYAWALRFAAVGGIAAVVFMAKFL
jgi:hypothetical protein